MKQAMINYVQKEKQDNLYTPEYAIQPILKYLPKDVKIWECTDYGDSKITKILKNNGYDIISTDIVKGFNFLKDKPNFDFDMIVTNPPYSLKDDFINKCYEYNKPFMLLLPITALEGKFRNELYSKNGISVIVLDQRCDFTGKGSNWFNTSWFCWNVDSIGNNKLIFEKLNK